MSRFAIIECPKIYRKSVLHLLKYTTNIYLSRCSTDLRYIWDTQYIGDIGGGGLAGKTRMPLSMLLYNYMISLV